MRDMLKTEGFGLKLLMEDLGFLDAGVKNLLKLTGLPGMDIWQFSSDYMLKMSEEEPQKAENRAFYTGTHDNETLIGWLLKTKAADSEESGNHEKTEPADEELLRTECETEALSMITKIYESKAALAMMQLQDVFLLGNEARMNVPGTVEGNWDWKVEGGSIEEVYPDAKARAAWLRELAESTGRI